MEWGKVSILQGIGGFMGGGNKWFGINDEGEGLNSLDLRSFTVQDLCIHNS